MIAATPIYCESGLARFRSEHCVSTFIIRILLTTFKTNGCNYFLLARRDVSYLTNMLIVRCSFIFSAKGREVTSVDCHVKECPHVYQKPSFKILTTKLEVIFTFNGLVR